MLAQGLIKRISDGSTTRIWEQNWLPRGSSMRPITCLVDNPPMFVSELIDNTSTTWRDDVIQQFFYPVDAAAIKSIPICTRPTGDFWAWQLKNKGCLSMRSACSILVNTRNM